MFGKSFRRIALYKKHIEKRMLHGNMEFQRSQRFHLGGFD